MAQRRRSLFLLPAIVFACSIAGGIYGPRIDVASAAPIEDVDKDVGGFVKALNLVEQNFAERPSADKTVYKGAIPGMLRTLDPHSNFFDPREFQLMREDQKGHYYGVGMQVGPQPNGKTAVKAPFPGFPAYKVGIRPGDVIVAVNDKSTEGLNTTEIADMLKGPRGTTVKIVISREGVPDYMTFTVVRDEIERKSVQDAFWIKPGIAYMKILSFTETTSREMEENLKRLGESNIKGLVLDLRENPGGLLNEGVAVADHFLPKGALIVTHRGRSAPEKAYVARNGNHGREYPMVVLVNRFSASAAEIVSGALQDHDRALILGETTFGKGLVQAQFPVDQGAALLLTIAHYYTPSGRLIQRDYSHRSFFDYYYARKQPTQNTDDVKSTDIGRKMLGGGGITPDEKYEGPHYSLFQRRLYNSSILFHFASTYFGANKPALPVNWMPDDQVVARFKDYLQSRHFPMNPGDFDRDKQWDREQIRDEFYLRAFDKKTSDRAQIMDDPEMAKAVEALPKAQGLMSEAQKLVPKKM